MNVVIGGIAVILIAQIIGLMTFLRYQKKINKIYDDTKRIKEVYAPELNELHKTIGLSRNEYENAASVIYGIEQNSTIVYNPEITDNPKTTEIENPITEENKEEDSQGKEELTELKELLDDEEDLTDILNEMENEDFIKLDDLQQPNADERKESEVGESIDLYNDIIQELENQQIEVFRENDDSPIVNDPIFQSDEPPLNEFPNYFSEQLTDNEHQELIQMLNLLDKEASRLEKEDQQDERKKELTQRLSALAEQGEGKKHMKEILLTLYELYELEGKEEELKEIKEEYKKYFNEELDIKIYDEDIIRLDRRKDKDPFELPEKYLWIASNTVSDNKQGEQTWIGKVIGKTQQYIHFRDMSQRIWIDVGERVDRIEIGDMLAVFVERTNDSVKAKEIFTLREVNQQNKRQAI